MAGIDTCGDGSGEPAGHWFNIAVDDNAFISPIPRALYVGVTGNLVVEDIDGNTVTFVAVAVGYHALRPRKLKTGTTATSIVGLY